MKCNVCNYNGKDAYYFNRHSLSKKHINNIEKRNKEINNKVLVCALCSMTLEKDETIKSHKKKCIDSLYYESLKTKEEMNANYNKYKEYYDANHTKDSSYNHIVKYYSNASIFEPYDLNQYLYKDQNVDDFINTIIDKFYNKKLYIYLSDKILLQYKKNDPLEQSIWNTDIERLNFVLNQSDNNNNTWNIDKGGILTKKLIVTPVIEYINNLLNIRINKNLSETQNNKKNRINIKMIETNLTLGKIMIKCEKNIFEQKIMRYIAQELFMTEKLKSLK